MKEENKWRKNFFAVLLLGILLIGVVMVVKPNTQTNVNSDCTGYVLNGVYYCNQVAYQEYMTTVQIINDMKQQKELEVNN